ncbi:hypothetical protein QEZ52_13660 [Aliisedimentitalea scapharcae]|uniref:Uncharacterized protein n=1 Tax=Aliisedimentitalea scapharcae TaxID=1524259 RepID=A0ABZ2XQI8_9RHOB
MTLIWYGWPQEASHPPLPGALTEKGRECGDRPRRVKFENDSKQQRLYFATIDLQSFENCEIGSRLFINFVVIMTSMCRLARFAALFASVLCLETMDCAGWANSPNK